MVSAEVGGMRWKWLAPMRFGRKRRICLSVVLALALLGLVLHLLPSFGIYPVVGRSMRPLLPPLGGLCVIERAGQFHPGDVIVFSLPGRTYPLVKRVRYINDVGQIWTHADNRDMTGEDSDQYGWVKPDAVIGVVVEVWSLKRAVRSLSAHGQFCNWLEMKVAPEQYTWSYDKKYAAIRGPGCTHVYSGVGERVAVVEGRFWRWHPDGRLIVRQVIRHEAGSYRQLCSADPPDFTVPKIFLRHTPQPLAGYRLIRHVEFSDAPAGETKVIEGPPVCYCRAVAPAPLSLRQYNYEHPLKPETLQRVSGKFSIHIPATEPFLQLFSEGAETPLFVDIYVEESEFVPVRKIRMGDEEALLNPMRKKRIGCT